MNGYGRGTLNELLSCAFLVLLGLMLVPTTCPHFAHELYVCIVFTRIYRTKFSRKSDKYPTKRLNKTIKTLLSHGRHDVMTRLKSLEYQAWRGPSGPHLCVKITKNHIPCKTSSPGMLCAMLHSFIRTPTGECGLRMEKPRGEGRRHRRQLRPRRPFRHHTGLS